MSKFDVIVYKRVFHQTPVESELGMGRHLPHRVGVEAFNLKDDWMMQKFPSRISKHVPIPRASSSHLKGVIATSSDMQTVTASLHLASALSAQCPNIIAWREAEKGEAQQGSTNQSRSGKEGITSLFYGSIMRTIMEFSSTA